MCLREEAIAISFNGGKDCPSSPLSTCHELMLMAKQALSCFTSSPQSSTLDMVDIHSLRRLLPPPLPRITSPLRIQYHLPTQHRTQPIPSRTAIPILLNHRRQMSQPQSTVQPNPLLTFLLLPDPHLTPDHHHHRQHPPTTPHLPHPPTHTHP